MEKPMAGFVVVLALLVAFCVTQVRSDGSDHRYKAGDPVPLYANKVGPFHNPRPCLPAISGSMSGCAQNLKEMIYWRIEELQRNIKPKKEEKIKQKIWFSRMIFSRVNKLELFIRIRTSKENERALWPKLLAKVM
ncbi:hypothetical protein U1Q18_039815 [Sarracenia purpurea var. burkii]